MNGTMRKDYYKILGVDKNASVDVVKSAHRKLVKQHHPDTGGDAEKFKEIQEAYEVLSDNNKRQRYDLGESDFTSNFNSSGFGPGSGSGFNFNVGDFFRRRHSYPEQGFQNPPIKGESIRLRTTLTLEEIAKGIKRDFSYEFRNTCEKCKDHPGLKKDTSKKWCPDCNGQGRVTHTSSFGGGSMFIQETTCYKCQGTGEIIDKVNQCSDCNGSGFKLKKTKISVNTPIGIAQNEVIVARGQGHCGLNKGSRGDLHISIDEEEHQIFSRDRHNILLELPITFGQAVLGDEVEVPTVYGNKIKITIPPKTNDGEYVIEKQKGLSINQQKIKGDMIVVFRINIPTIEDNEEYKELFDKMKSMKISDKKVEDIKNYMEKNNV